jgi:hypothetical protein
MHGFIHRACGLGGVNTGFRAGSKALTPVFRAADGIDVVLPGGLEALAGAGNFFLRSGSSIEVGLGSLSASLPKSIFFWTGAVFENASSGLQPKACIQNDDSS